MFETPAHEKYAGATVRQMVKLKGVGLHSGEIATLLIEPALPHSGIRFIRSDLDGPVAARTIPADPFLVSQTQLGTVLTNVQGSSIATVEHLMAAFAMMGISDAHVSVSGPEVPILDGSSQDFIEAIQSVGVLRFPHIVERLAPVVPVTVNHGDSWAIAEPLPQGTGVDLILDVTIDFDHPCIGTQSIVIKGDVEAVMAEVANARTFTELRLVETLREQGLARGGSLDNAVVLGDRSILNPEGLRRDKEFVRHKTLDLVGDLYLTGCLLGCKVTAYKPGHTLNTMLAQALCEHLPNIGVAAGPQALSATA